MSGKCFIDTNIFVYMFDAGASVKAKKAKHIINQAVNEGLGIISYQVVQEFFSVASKKFAKPMSMYECLYLLDNLLMPICTVFPNIDFYKLAFAIKDEVGCALYDALIIAAAVQEKCAVLYSEDLQHGRVISGVRIQNPFL